MRTEDMIWEAVRASIEAGEAILKVYDTDFEVQSKSDESPLTKADMESHLIISKALSQTGIPLLSEEGKSIPYTERKEWNMFWMVDPLDGTKEFVNRNGEFTVNIALIEDGYPVAGIIYIPVTDELFVGMEALGAIKFKEVKQLLMQHDSFSNFLAQGTPLPAGKEIDKFTVVCSRSHMSDETAAFIDELKEVHGQLNFVSRGSSLKLCMVAEGMANIYPRFAPTMEWDTAAGQAIAEASGAKVIHAQTKARIGYNKENLLNPWFIVER